MIKCFYWYGPCIWSEWNMMMSQESSDSRWSALNSDCVWWTEASVMELQHLCITHTVQNWLFYTWLWLAIAFYYCPLNCLFQLKNKQSSLLYWAEQYGETNAFVIFLIKLIMQFFCIHLVKRCMQKVIFLDPANTVF